MDGAAVTALPEIRLRPIFAGQWTSPTFRNTARSAADAGVQLLEHQYNGWLGKCPLVCKASRGKSGILAVNVKKFNAAGRHLAVWN
jgi:hypothetical protein